MKENWVPASRSGLNAEIRMDGRQHHGNGKDDWMQGYRDLSTYFPASSLLKNSTVRCQASFAAASS